MALTQERERVVEFSREREREREENTSSNYYSNSD
jgi:hypothetical protein